MESVLAKYSACISELKKNPDSVLKHAGKNVIAIFKRNKPAAYLIPAELYEALLNNDYNSGCIVQEKQNEKLQQPEADSAGLTNKTLFGIFSDFISIEGDIISPIDVKWDAQE
jgi:antitoxin StbD